MLFAIYLENWHIAWQLIPNNLLCSQHLSYPLAWLCSAGCSHIFSRSNDIEILIKGSMSVSQHDVIPLPSPVELTALDAQ